MTLPGGFLVLLFPGLTNGRGRGDLKTVSWLMFSEKGSCTSKVPNGRIPISKVKYYKEDWERAVVRGFQFL